jgi:hypothetical protein
LAIRKNVIIAALVAASTVGAASAVALLSRGSALDRGPPVAQKPRLEPVTRTSTVVVPVTVAIASIGEAMEAAAPHELAGNGAVSQRDMLVDADLQWTVTRGPLVIAGRPDVLAVSTPLAGSVRATGRVPKQMGELGAMIGGMIGGNLGRQLQDLRRKPFDERADLRGNATATARPAIVPEWRIEPNFAAKVTIADATIRSVGIRLDVSKQAKPLVDRSVDGEIAAWEARVRNDPFLERLARREWPRLCRAVPLGAFGPGMPQSWLEIRPTRALASQPRIDATGITVAIGVEAQIRIVAEETTPDCPFPARLDIVPQTEQGRLNIAVPIDLAFNDINRLLAAQLAGRTFPEDGNGAGEVTIQRAKLAASGDRLVISLSVAASEKSYFGFGGQATIHASGRPVLDREHQILRLTDLEFDVHSEGILGLLGSAARWATPVRAALAEKAVLDLRPYAESARKRIEVVIDELRSRENGLRIDAALSDLRLVDIDFDSDMLRLIAESDGTARAAVATLPVP